MVCHRSSVLLMNAKSWIFTHCSHLFPLDISKPSVQSCNTLTNAVSWPKIFCNFYKCGTLRTEFLSLFVIFSFLCSFKKLLLLYYNSVAIIKNNPSVILQLSHSIRSDTDTGFSNISHSCSALTAFSVIAQRIPAAVTFSSFKCKYLD